MNGSLNGHMNGSLNGHMNGSWEAEPSSRHPYLNGSLSNESPGPQFDPFNPTLLPETSASHPQGSFPTEAQPPFIDPYLQQASFPLGPYGAPMDLGSGTAGRGTFMEGISQADLRAALQQPHNARYIQQLELEALWAKTHQQPKVFRFPLPLPPHTPHSNPPLKVLSLVSTWKTVPDQGRVHDLFF